VTEGRRKGEMVRVYREEERTERGSKEVCVSEEERDPDKKGGRRENKWDTCPIVSGWEKME
jgi:hypothetical protein